MAGLTIRKDPCALDFLALGAVVHRLDPGVIPFRKARTLEVHVSGGEYNVARGLRRCFGLRTAVVTALVDNPVGRLVEDLFEGRLVERDRALDPLAFRLLGRPALRARDWRAALLLVLLGLVFLEGVDAGEHEQLVLAAIAELAVVFVVSATALAEHGCAD